MRLVASLAIAISMYSRIPAPTVEWNQKNMKYAMCFFPVVGVITGLLELGIGYVLLTETSCGKVFFAAVMTLVPVIVTGGIHLDGYADTIDALSSCGDREKKLQILKDSHAGAFAVIGLCVYFTASVAVWSEAEISMLPLAACIFPLSRSLSGISVVTFRAAKDSGLLRTFQDGAQRRRVRAVLVIWACADVCVMALSAYRYGPGGMAAPAVMTAAALLVFLHYYGLCRKQFGGTTGDLAGYFLQVCELGMLAAGVLTWNLR
ncbi:MAG TPA: adenosylcobinamide-GDP ribazoletransferase [Candidatus Mediterraneibacter merdipullorum]|nr:adenosylcobinamide-GDP ribazoletransferase [Candidatus Mediterraneibacter merdipullorum]